MERKSWLLAIISSPGRSGAENEAMDPVRIMKSLFLLGKEAGDQLPNFYEFEPYLYGPCSFEIYEDLEVLKGKGLIDEERAPYQRWSYYRLTANGIAEAENVLKEITDPLRAKMMDIKRLVMELSFLSLLKYVYEKYPEYGKHSLIRVPSVG